MPLEPSPPNNQALIAQGLRQLFGNAHQEDLKAYYARLDWVNLRGGEDLFKEGDPGKDAFFLLRGRLVAHTQGRDGEEMFLGEIGRGEIVGEMALLTGQKRMASVTAVRSSTLVRISQAVLNEILQAYPGLALQVTRRVILRMQSNQDQKKHPREPDTICIFPLDTPNEALQRLETSLMDAKKVGILRRQDRDERGLKGRESEIQQWLDQEETDHELLLLYPDREDADWTERCLRQADQIVFLANADQNPELRPHEARWASLLNKSVAPQILLLWHGQEKGSPQGTARWFAPRPKVLRHYHFRAWRNDDAARIVRCLIGNAQGLALAGGGAKGFAHLGVYRLLREEKLPIDYLGGTSIGAMVAASIAFDPDIDELVDKMRWAIAHNPTRDVNLIPLVSLIRGKRLREMIAMAINAYTGQSQMDLSDTWLPLFVVASNLSQAREEVFTRGDLHRLLQASASIPGVFPPVVNGNDLLVDGGNFNNFPADIMQQMGVSRVIGVDFVLQKNRKLNYSQTPGTWALLRDRMRPGAKRRYKIPSMTSIITNSALLYSIKRRNETIAGLDLHFNPRVQHIGVMSWKSFDQALALGYQHAREVWQALDPNERGRLRKA